MADEGAEEEVVEAVDVVVLSVGEVLQGEAAFVVAAAAAFVVVVAVAVVSVGVEEDRRIYDCF